MNPDVAHVVEELDAHRERFVAFCRSLSKEQLLRPVPKSTWVVRDFIAHLGTIDRPVGGMFQAMHGVAGAGWGAAGGGIDDWNDREVAERRMWPLERVLEEMAETRAELHRHLGALTAEDVQKSMDFGGDSKRAAAKVRLLDYLRGWNKHDPMHAVDMLRALPDCHTPEIEAWIDHPVIRGYQAAMNRE
ncbi:MAG: DinB family protein [Dehalococcoidia bacterium]